MNETVEVNGYAPIHFASLARNFDAVGVLLDFGADVSLTGRDGRTCLHLATEKGGPKIVKLLLVEHGAINMINKTDERGEAPLCI